MKLGEEIDWRRLAEALGRITYTEHGRTESGGTDAAREALASLLGLDALRATVDYYVSGAPGSELARSVLWLLQPPSAMERCHEIYLEADDILDRRVAVELLRVVADDRILPWVPQYLSDPDPQIQIWGIGVVDQLLTSNRVEWDACEAVLETADSHPNEAVRRKAAWIRENLGPA